VISGKPEIWFACQFDDCAVLTGNLPIPLGSCHTVKAGTAPGEGPDLELLGVYDLTRPQRRRGVLKIIKKTSTMSNFEQTQEWGAGNFLADVGGIHAMPEQKRFRGRLRV
jgi:hypothetical protein